MTFRYGLAAVLALALSPAVARGEAPFVVQARGPSVDDQTPAAPQGGNSATTLAGQRLAAVNHAAKLLGAKLDSEVPIEIDLVSRAYGCDQDRAVLATAGAVSLFSGVELPGADRTVWYPSALANRLAGRDLAPNEADILVTINTSIDAECRGRFGGFYYGFDARAGGQIDLVSVVLHELAHGLGFASFIDLDDGLPMRGGVDMFSSHVFDLAAQKSWSELSAEERLASSVRARGLAFRGARTTSAASKLLAKGAPTLTLDRMVPRFVGAVGDRASYTDTAGAVRIAGRFESCADGAADLTRALVLIRPDCPLSLLESRLIAAGAAGILLSVESKYTQPAYSLPINTSGTLPVMTVSVGDADAMIQALAQGPLEARMAWDPKRLVGADAEGRPLLFASEPVDRGASVSHFEPLARPDLLMEPFIRARSSHDLDLTLPVLQDLGWEPFCGNGRLDGREQCDLGEANSDVTPGACRTSCVRAACGDGVRDAEEACDEGAANSDALADACRADCSLPRCGDGVIDRGEACDDGTANDDDRPSACRSDCRHPRCGDGVLDEGEACDEGAQNGASPSSSCQTDCRPTRCSEAARPDACDGAVSCGARCPAPTGTNQQSSTWLDPWDAPPDDGPEKRRRDSGCTLARERATPLHDASGAALLLAILALRRLMHTRRSARGQVSP